MNNTFTLRWFDFVLAPLSWVVLALIRLVLIVVGLAVVAMAIPFARPGVSQSDYRPIVNLPKWAWLWGNDFDGLDGDKRLWWAEQCDGLVLFGLLPKLRKLSVFAHLPPCDPQGYLARYWWTAVRNPVNNLRLVSWFNCPVSECEIIYQGQAMVEDKPGQGGSQFVVARKPGQAMRWYGYYLVKEKSPTTALVVRLGYKIKPEHQGSSEPAKGMTFKVNLNKSI